ncbi:hypothetical protein ACI7RC_16725 [Brevibacillus sp. B_LB10_24]|uniref:hypothetical protein n=1 Tax=Brevibacillus sp. B_LB10_24 TaxID=3380645 RepID=UPI0038B73C9D
MPMESEVFWYLVAGAGFVLTISFIVIMGLWKITKNKTYIWFIAHLISLSCGIYLFLTLIRPQSSSIGMISEFNSGRIGAAGILWAISMGCMLKGIWDLHYQKSTKDNHTIT